MDNTNHHKSLYLHNLAHTSSPPLTQYINNKLLRFNRDKSINYPESTTKICQHCGVNLIPGISLSIRLGRSLDYKCMKCRKSRSFIVKEQIKVKEVEVKEVNKAKDRKKKRNQTLSKMLQKKTETRKGLDLMDFTL